MLRSPNTLGIATLAPAVSHHVDERWTSAAS
jgi:hypothetical protein